MNPEAKAKLKAHRKMRPILDAAHDEAIRMDRLRTEEFSRIKPLRLASTGMYIIKRKDFPTFGEAIQDLGFNEAVKLVGRAK